MLVVVTLNNNAVFVAKRLARRALLLVLISLPRLLSAVSNCACRFVRAAISARMLARSALLFTFNALNNALLLAFN